jgi:sugar (pentulose or hexulose) kinase
MMDKGWTIVLDVGKTFSKVTLWDEGGTCVAMRSRQNQRAVVGGGLILDAVGIERWLEGALREFAAAGPVDAIIPVAHGAAAALIRDGRLQCAPIDYEWPGVNRARPPYDKERDPFTATGSPALPAGLNLGVQLHWLESLRTENYRLGQIIPWAQYWAWLFSGIAASEVTSLGCHTDMWRPYDRAPSELAVRRGWAERLGPLTPAHSVLGQLTPQWVKRTGLSDRVQVYCGLHDSNAALFAARQHRAMQGHDATVLSTGTWFVAMRCPLPAAAAPTVQLQEGRDCLVNVDMTGAPVPSSRFMGGREIEVLAGAATSGAGAAPDTEAAQLVAAIRAIDAGQMILPTSVLGVGPFPTAKTRRVGAGAEDADSTTLAHLYAALVADVSLDLIGSRDTLLIDGRFSQTPVFTQALARLRPATTILISNDDQGVARGALRLVNKDQPEHIIFQPVSPLPVDMTEYRARWRDAAGHAA